jgi:hypothetical protein
MAGPWPSPRKEKPSLISASLPPQHSTPSPLHLRNTGATPCFVSLWRRKEPRRSSSSCRLPLVVDEAAARPSPPLILVYTTSASSTQSNTSLSVSSSSPGGHRRWGAVPVVPDVKRDLNHTAGTGARQLVRGAQSGILSPAHPPCIVSIVTDLPAVRSRRSPSNTAS